MTATYDPTTDAGKVRLLISDTNTADALFTDDEIAAFLALDSNVYMAAALGLRTIAGNEVQVLKVIRLLDLTTDGAAVARELRMQADGLEARARQSGTFEVAEFALPPFGSRQRLANQIMRGEL